MSKLPLSMRVAANAAASLVLAFLVLPILAVVPASFNKASFIYLPPKAYSGVWYERFLADAEWRSSLVNSIEVALLATALAVVLGTLAAIGLRRINGRARAGLTALFLAPMIVPVIVTAVALYRSALDVGLSGTILGMSARPYAAGAAVRRHQCRHRLARGRRQLAQGRLRPRRRTVDRLPHRHAAEHRSRHRRRRNLLLHHLVRRGDHRRLLGGLRQQDPSRQSLGIDPAGIHARSSRSPPP